ncbi:MAG: mitofilin family membrane protein [Pseudomonadota bacterium]
MAEKNGSEREANGDAPPDVEAEVVQHPDAPPAFPNETNSDLNADSAADIDPDPEAAIDGDESVEAREDAAPPPKRKGVKLTVFAVLIVALLVAGALAWQYGPFRGDNIAVGDNVLELPAVLGASSGDNATLSEPPLSENPNAEEVVEIDPFSTIESGNPETIDGEDGGGASALDQRALPNEIPSEAVSGAEARDIGNSSDALADAKESFLRETESLRLALADERARTDKLSQEIDALKRAMNEQSAARSSVSPADVDALRDRISKLENNAPTAREAASALAFATLREAAAGSEPFVAAWRDVARLASGAPAVGVLAPLAESGAPTLAMLLESFDAASRTGLAVAGEELATSAGEKLIARAQSLVSVRPTDAQEGNAPRAIVSRAENHLGDGDINAALEELKSLPPGAQQAMADWAADARDRADISEAIADLAPLFTVEETQ